MIVVTGATGNLGTRIVERLLDRVPASQIGVSVRDPRKARSLAERGVRVRAGDFNDPASLDAAFAGADHVVIVSASIRGHEAAVAANVGAIDAARRAGAKRITYTSHQAASGDSRFPPMRVHSSTEDHLAASGVPYTALRNGFYGSSIAAYLGGVRQTGRITVPQDGPVSWTDHADLAEAAAIAATEDGVLDGPTPPLTGPGLLDFAAIAAITGDVLGRPVELVTVADEEWQAAQVHAGMPAAAADFSLAFFRAARNREFAVADPTLARVIGHLATPVTSTVERLLAPA
jgi:uncharacterized protein YbjT (DUF2867 family)